jgi:crotonobetainyl-CoA:carnitine CoA-transferase CaiB-like acyl-CoA transferase
MDITSDQLPLHGLNVVELCHRRGHSTGRFLADLGAELLSLVDDNNEAIDAAPLFNNQSLRFAVHSANKQLIKIKFSVKRQQAAIRALLADADILLIDEIPAALQEADWSLESLHADFPLLIILSIKDFGLRGPYKDFTASESVHMAMSTVLSRSGRAGREPLLPPGEMALETTGVQAAWVALLAYWQRRRLGIGDVLDFSINDALAQILDPGIGSSGSASAGRTPVEVAPHSRPLVEAVPGKLPSVALMYPVFQCADGSIRLCVLNPRQWQAMSDWLGDTHPFTDPKYKEARNRLLNIDKINPLIARLFTDKTRAELVAQGRERGIPIAPLAKPAELFDNTHFAERAFFTAIDINGSQGLVPAGYLCVDGRRLGIRHAAQSQTLKDARFTTSNGAMPEGTNMGASARPLSGIRVLDLGVIVAGGELGRMFADQGADVIKLENKSFGDGLRQSIDNNPVSISFAQASRGKRSLGLNLRSDQGKALFYKLVAQADIVLSNFKPGTTESLGIDYATLKAINPRIICAESSAMGSTGPDAKTMGYGPLVRASTALTGLWRYLDQDDGYGDGVTIYPDHFVARVSSTAILAKLIQRQRTGLGGFVDLSQAECIMTALGTEFLRESLEPGSMVAKGNHNEFDAPNSIFQCAGDDQWCAISVSTAAHWQGLCSAMARDDWRANLDYSHSQGRLAARDIIEQQVADWCKERSPHTIRDLLQANGVPAANMLRLQEFLQNPHYRARGFFRVLHQPTAGRPLATENGPLPHCELIPEPKIRQAPARAEHSREIAATILGVTDDEFKKLVASGDIEQGHSASRGARSQKYKTMAISAAMTGVLQLAAIRSKFEK